MTDFPVILLPANVELSDGRRFVAEPCVIERTKLGFEDHGCMTFLLDLASGGAHQGYGTLILSDYDKELKRQKGTAFGLDILLGILRVVCVDDWEQLKGRRVYALREKPYDWIKGIANLDDPRNHLITDDLRKQWYPDRS